MSDSLYSNLNRNLGAVQTDVYTGYTVSLPVVERSLMLFANVIDLESNQAELHTIRKFDQLNLDDYSRTPISRTILNDDRIQSISGATVNMRAYPYGVSLIIDNFTRVNSKEAMLSNCIKLFADWGSRLQESLLFNMLRGASGSQYVFALADTTGGGSSSRPNVSDAIAAKSILDKNRVRRTFMRMIRATQQVGTRPVGQSFVGHVSVGGRAAWEQNLSSDEVTRPYENPSVSDYLYQNVFYIRRADTSLYHSTEMYDTQTHRQMLIHGDEAYTIARQTPFGNKTIVDPEYRSAFGMHSKVSYRLTHAQAVLRNERIVNCIFTDA